MVDFQQESSCYTLSSNNIYLGLSTSAGTVTACQRRRKRSCTADLPYTLCLRHSSSFASLQHAVKPLLDLRSQDEVKRIMYGKQNDGSVCEE